MSNEAIRIPWQCIAVLFAVSLPVPQAISHANLPPTTQRVDSREEKTTTRPSADAGSKSRKSKPKREEGTVIIGDTGRRIAELAQNAAADGFSGAVLAAVKGRVVAAIGVGHADLEEKQQNSPDTLFEIASASKQFTAAAVMRLVQEDKLKLEDSIARHLPPVPEDCKEITIEHLLRHTSGIPGANSQGAGDDIEKVLPAFLHGGPTHPPGTHWEYWNQGYAIISEIIRRASGKKYTVYCKKALFEPAGLNVTCFTGDKPPKGMVVAVGRSSSGSPRSALEHPYGSYGFQYRGMGGIVTTVWDLWRWDRALRDKTILDADAKRELFRPGLNNYALGWFVAKNAHGQLVQSHGGGVRGFTCDMRRYPEQNAFLVILCNRDDFRLHALTEAIEAAMFRDVR